MPGHPEKALVINGCKKCRDGVVSGDNSSPGQWDKSFALKSLATFDVSFEALLATSGNAGVAAVAGEGETPAASAAKRSRRRALATAGLTGRGSSLLRNRARIAG